MGARDSSEDSARGGDKPRNRLPWKRSRTQQVQALLQQQQQQQQHASSDAAAIETGTSQSRAINASSPAAKRGGRGARVPRAVVAPGEGHKVSMIPADRAVCDSNTAHGIGRSNQRLPITGLREGASPHGAGY